MLGVGTGMTGSAVLPLAGRELEGVGEAETDGVGAGEGVVLGRGDGFGVGLGREGSGPVEVRTAGSAVLVEPSGTTRCPCRKYAYQARTVRRYAAEWL